MPVFDAELTVSVEIAYVIEEGKVIVDAVLVYGTGENLPLNDSMAHKVVELCWGNEKEERRGNSKI
jgi:hypothetical protein